MSKYVFAFYKKDAKKHLMKVVIDGVNNDDEIWAETTKAVHDYAKNNFEEGQDCDFEFNESDGKYTITKILKKGTTTTKTATKKITKDTGYKCEDCGKALKDGKYKKCYICNQKNPVKKTKKTDNYYTKSPEVQESIKRQAIGHMTSRSLIALQGHIDPNNAPDLIKSIYALYQELVG